MTRAGWTFAVLLLGLATLRPGPVGAEVRKLEAVGVAPAGADAPTGVSVRQAAIEAGVRRAVLKVAERLLGWEDPLLEPAVAEALGDRPFDYISRYRMLEDRGEQRALLVDDPSVTNEYVVRVEVHVDVDRVRRRLEDASLLVQEPRGTDQPFNRVAIILEDLRSYRVLVAIRDRLRADPAVRSVVPQEFVRGKALLAVETHRSAEALLAALLADAPEGMEIHSLPQNDGRLHLRVVEQAPAAAAAERAPEPGSAPAPARRYD